MFYEAEEDEPREVVAPLIHHHHHPSTDRDDFRTGTHALNGSIGGSGSGSGIGSGDGGGGGGGGGVTGLERVASVLAGPNGNGVHSINGSGGDKQPIIISVPSDDAASNGGSGSGGGADSTSSNSRVYRNTAMSGVVSGFRYRGLKHIPIRPVSRSAAAIWLSVPGVWLLWNAVLIAYAVAGLVRSAAHASATEEVCPNHSVSQFIRTTIFHGLACGSLLALYIYRLVTQLKSTHLQISTSLGFADFTARTGFGFAGGGSGGGGMRMEAVGQDLASDKPVSISLPLPFVFKESWGDVVIEYLLGLSVVAAAVIAFVGEYFVGGIGLLILEPTAIDCHHTAPILFGCAADLSYCYSVVLVFVSVFALRKALDSAVLKYCQ